MRDASPTTIHLKDYRAPDYWIDTTDLSFELYEDHCIVNAKLGLRLNPDHPETPTLPNLVLHGQELELLSVQRDGQTLSAAQDYQQAEESLSIQVVAKAFTLELQTRIEPQNNTSLEGLYKSTTMFCTQCEAEGFRKITYYLDRPDVMSVFSTQITADKATYPILLSNGNNVARGDSEGGRHWVRWEDPFKKPAYLFALVAGDLGCVKSSFTTMSGREVALELYTEARNIDKCDHALLSLQRSMTWDEQVYGREYDLDIFMIVAVDDFNMGAMENKGLNIFNSSCVLAKPEASTDAAFQRIEAIVAHEYFHNWSGNRVTCRDWFQLSLKEGFTVFRDCEFSSDMNSRTVKRIEDVSLLRTAQFAEDAGPMSHAVRPASYMEISNFYTLTIYEKGCEIVRMIHSIVGVENFRKGSDLYFDRHDGEAATVEDFVGAMSDASGVDLAQFSLWYAQAGTPVLKFSDSYDEATQTYRLRITQSCPPTPGQAEKQALHIPVALGLLDAEGQDLLEGGTQMLALTQDEQSFEFTGISRKPVPSLLRSFSAPVRIEYAYSRDELMFLMSHDSDGFNRWDAGQQLAISVLQELIEQQLSGKAMQLDERLVQAFGHILRASELDPAMLAKMLMLPSEAYLTELAEVACVDEIHAAREFTLDALAQAHAPRLAAIYASQQDTAPYSPVAADIAKRSLKNAALAYLVRTEQGIALAEQQFAQGANMTDVYAALQALISRPQAQDQASAALESFYQKWQQDPQVVEMWLSAQAASGETQGLHRVKALMQHEAFDLDNPNKLRSVVGVFCNQNAVGFHALDGSGYAFLADQVITLNTRNPQIAARLITPLTRWKKYSKARQELMREQLQRIAQEKLSKDLFEVVSKSLA